MGFFDRFLLKIGTLTCFKCACFINKEKDYTYKKIHLVQFNNGYLVNSKWHKGRDYYCGRCAPKYDFRLVA